MRKLIPPIVTLCVIGLIASGSMAVADDVQQVPEAYLGKTAKQWHARYVREHKALTRHGQMLRDEMRAHRIGNMMLIKELAKRGEGTSVMAIRMVFGSYAEQAIRVSACETGNTFSTNATNGQYLGLFQMGDYARGRYGHSSSALGQAQSAYRYFVASGKDWSPWSCKP